MTPGEMAREQIDKTPVNEIIKELSRRYNISFVEAERIEKKLEDIGFLMIVSGDMLWYLDIYRCGLLTLDTVNELTTRDYKPFNVFINIKRGMIGAIATAAIEIVVGGHEFLQENTLFSVASLMGAVFSALSLAKIEFSKNETAILLSLENGKMDEETCYSVTNSVLKDYNYEPINKDDFTRALNNLYSSRCVSINEGTIKLNEIIKS